MMSYRYELIRLNLRNVAAEAKKRKQLILEIFFAAKTHKSGIYFPTIVSERVNSVQIDDPFCIPYSMPVIDVLKYNNPEGGSTFSIDVEVSYYSMPHDEVMMSEESVF